MKSVRSVVLAALAVAVLGGVACVVVLNRQPAREAPPESAKAVREAESPRAQDAMRSGQSRPAARTARQRPLPPENVGPSAGKPQADIVKTDGQADAKAQKAAPAKQGTPKAAQAKQATRPAQEAIKDPMARVALAFVGADPDAEAYWYEAINNPDMSAHERQDLIEDLNEDGLSDPKNPTADDLPLILNRLQLIEAIVWDAMDEVNADAFLEAYKDLVNLANLVLGGGEPVG